MSPRLSARERMARLLSVIPWVAERDGATIDEIVARFAYPRQQLLRDLREVVFFVGVHPFTPDTLIDVDISDDRVRIRYADWFAKPLRLTPSEGARLFTAGRTVLQAGSPLGEEAEDPLLRALLKLGVTLGEDAEAAVEVRLGDAPQAVLSDLRSAIQQDCQVDIEYYSYGRDELTHRSVDPWRVFSDAGNWYLAGWCHRARAERVFRVDRILEVTHTERRRDVSGDAGDIDPFAPRDGDPRVTIRVAPEAEWVIHQYPTESVEHSDDGHLDVTLTVTALPWLERLLLRLGPQGSLRDAGGLPADLLAAAARRTLAVYDRTSA
ncbi:MAG: helix-turn-helix transcriptional regulator [Acidimicrobiales bacterium]